MINRPRVFQWLLRVEPELSHFKAGTYRFTPQMTVREMLQLLASGKEAQFPLRFVEGMRVSDYLRQLRDAPYVKHTLEDDSYATVAKALGLEHADWVEGWFWPDTWMYTANTSDIAILKRAHQKMVAEVAKVWEGRMENLPYADQNQLLTMASIIEKRDRGSGRARPRRVGIYQPPAHRYALADRSDRNLRDGRRIYW